MDKVELSSEPIVTRRSKGAVRVGFRLILLMTVILPLLAGTSIQAVETESGRLMPS